MKTLIPAPESKKRFNPYQFALSSLNFFKTFGGVILLIGGTVGFIAGVLVVPGNPVGIFENLVVLAVFASGIAAVAGFAWLFGQFLLWIHDDGPVRLADWFQDKADSHGKIED